MKAIVIREFGPPQVMRVEDVPDPVPGPGQVLVRVRAAGVNPVDTYIRAGGHPSNPSLPYTPGSDGAGTVERVGPGVTGLAPGDRVYIGRSVSGTYAELSVCEPGQLHPLSERLSFEQGAGVWVPYATAYRALVQRACARAGDWVLVHGASGGVGIAALQIGTSLGMRLIGTAGTPQGRDLARSHGAIHTLDHTTPDYPDEVRRITGHPAGGVDIVLEMLANVNLERDLGVLAVGGRVVVIGSRGKIEITPRQMMGRDSSVMGMSLLHAPAPELVRIARALDAGLSNGTLTPVVGAVLPLARASEAHEKILAPGAHGKIVLVP